MCISGNCFQNGFRCGWRICAAEREVYEEVVLNAEIARKLCELRTKAGLSQRELAEQVGTSALAICRLEDADSEGLPFRRSSQ